MGGQPSRPSRPPQSAAPSPSSNSPGTSLDIADPIAVSAAVTCPNCTLSIPTDKVSSSTVVLTRDILGQTNGKVYTSDDLVTKNPDAIKINTDHFSALTRLFLKPTLPFKITYNQTTHTARILSLYQPFPLRLDDATQPEGCLQIGEFDKKDTLVVLIPLQSQSSMAMSTDQDTLDSMDFVNRALMGYTPSAIPDVKAGFPDSQSSTGAAWFLSKVLKVDRPFFTWVNSGGTRVIVMAEPIIISPNAYQVIQKMPVTQPSDAIHEVQKYNYKAAPPKGGCVNCVPTKLKVQASGPTPQQKAGEAMGATVVAAVAVGAIVMLYIYRHEFWSGFSGTLFSIRDQIVMWFLVAWAFVKDMILKGAGFGDMKGSLLALATADPTKMMDNPMFAHVPPTAATEEKGVFSGLANIGKSALDTGRRVTRRARSAIYSPFKPVAPLTRRRVPVRESSGVQAATDALNITQNPLFRPTTPVAPDTGASTGLDLEAARANTAAAAEAVVAPVPTTPVVEAATAVAEPVAAEPEPEPVPQTPVAAATEAVEAVAAQPDLTNADLLRQARSRLRSTSMNTGSTRRLSDLKNQFLAEKSASSQKAADLARRKAAKIDARAKTATAAMRSTPAALARFKDFRLNTTNDAIVASASAPIPLSAVAPAAPVVNNLLSLRNKEAADRIAKEEAARNALYVAPPPVNEVRAPVLAASKAYKKPSQTYVDFPSAAANFLEEKGVERPSIYINTIRQSMGLSQHPYSTQLAKLKQQYGYRGRSSGGRRRAGKTYRGV